MNSLNPLCTMKTNKLIAAALLPLLFSCAKENIAPADNNAAEGNYVTINLAPDSDAVTRATFDDSKGIIWQPGVKAGLIKMEKNWNPVESESLAEDKIYDYEDPKNDYKKSWQASFKFNLAESDYTGSYKFFYPYHSEAAYTGDYIRIPFWVAPNQSSGVGQSSEVFAVVSKDMVTLDPENHDTPAVTYYKVVGSYIRFLVYGKAGEKVKSISIQSEQTPSGLYYVNGNTNQLNGEAYTDYSKLVTVSVNGDYSTPATKSAASGIYASVLPRALKNTYTVETDKGWYKFESQNEAEFAFGSIKDVLLNLENTKCKYAPAKLFIIGGATTAGWNAEKAIQLTKVEGKHQFELKGIQLTAGEGDSGFKFLTEQGKFENVYVNGENDNKTITYYEDPGIVGKDIKFTVDKSGIYNLTVNFDDCSLTADLVSEYPRVLSYNKSNTYYMTPTAVEKEYKATAYLGQGDDAHDFFIYQGEEAYHEADFKQIAFSSDSEGYSGTVTKDTNTGLGWWISDDNRQTNRLYDITLNTATNKVTVKFAQGTNFWLIGYPFGGYNAFNKPDEYKATVDENGVAKWKVTTSATGDFKICGEHTLSNSFYDGEWYYSTEPIGTFFDWSWDTGNNYSTDTEVKEFDVKAFIPNGADYKWSLNETGTFEIVFDTKNLKIKIYKTN